VLGAVLAGMVLRTWLRREDLDAHPLEEKLDAVGYGIFIPIFFVTSGMTLDVPAMVKNPLRVLAFLVLLLVVRGLPSLVIYRKALPRSQRIQMTFITATTLPLLIALAEIGLQDGVMLPANAAAMVGAGVLSVLIYPAVAVGLARRARWTATRPGAITAPAAADQPGVAPAGAGPVADGARGTASDPGPRSGPGTDGWPETDRTPGIAGTPGIEEAPDAPAG
jgi:Kef-type K+ transport system membrane component KefB